MAVRAGAVPGSRATRATTPAKGAHTHYVNLVHHPGLGVVFLDGQHAMIARLPQNPASLELWVTHAAEPIDIPEPGHLPPTGGSGQAGTQTTQAGVQPAASSSAGAGPSGAAAGGAGGPPPPGPGHVVRVGGGRGVPGAGGTGPVPGGPGR